MLCANKLTTFANILDPYQARQNYGLDLDPDCFSLWSHEYKDDNSEIGKWLEHSFGLHVLDYKILLPPTRQVNRATYNDLSFIIGHYYVADIRGT